MDSNVFRIPSLIEKEQNKLGDFFNYFKKELFLYGLDQKQTDAVVKLTKSLVSETQNSIDFLLKNTAVQPRKIVADLLDRSKIILDGMNSQYKRLILILYVEIQFNYKLFYLS